MLTTRPGAISHHHPWQCGFPTTRPPYWKCLLPRRTTAYHNIEFFFVDYMLTTTYIFITRYRLGCVSVYRRPYLPCARNFIPLFSSAIRSPLRLYPYPNTINVPLIYILPIISTPLFPVCLFFSRRHVMLLLRDG